MSASPAKPAAGIPAKPPTPPVGDPGSESGAGPGSMPGAGIAARAMAARKAGYLDKLNPEQRRAVEALDGPVLVLAGAGTGKTRVLTTRIAHILSQGRARPGQILAVTFTNKAAREMKARVSDLIGGVVEGMPWLGTFHAIGVKILRRHAELVDLKPSFTVLDTDDQIRLIKQLLQAENIDEVISSLHVHLMGNQTLEVILVQGPPGELQAIADEMSEVSTNGSPCSTYADCVERLADGLQIDYDGPSGITEIQPRTGVTQRAVFDLFTFDGDGASVWDDNLTVNY